MPVLLFLVCVLMTSFLFFDGPRSASEIDFVSQTKRRPDSRPTKHQKEERVRRGGVDTNNARRREVQSLLYACGSGVGVARRQSATSHTLTADTFNVFAFWCVQSLLAFLWLLRKSPLLVAFKKVFAQTRIFKRQRNNTSFLQRKENSRFCTMLMVALCGVGWVLCRVGPGGAVVRGESGAIKQGFLLKTQFLFSRRTQKGGEELARRDLVTGSACMKTNFHARTKMRLLLCRRRRAVEKHALALSLFFGVHVVTL